jgi:aminoglycoside phosphotransferase (APT) family kinase protein
LSARQEQNSGTSAVREQHRFDEARLASWLADHVEGFEGPLTVRQFRGGQSNPTYLLETGAGRYVLRRKPPGQLLKSAHAVDREFRVISMLHAADFPVPRPFALCADESVIGTMFFVMAFVDGRIFWDLDLPGCTPAERTAIYDAVNATIARLHNLDFAAIGLADFGRAGNYFERQISRWTQQYRASETRNIEAMNELIEWLPANIPADESAGIVHGDFRLDNLVIHPTEARVLAVLDWELATIGHPLADFTYHLLPWQMPEVGLASIGLKGKDLAALGIPDEEAYVRRYCERTGRSGIPHRGFYGAFNLFRLAAILQGIAGRVRDGTAASAHAREAAATVEPLASLGLVAAARN